MNDVGYTLVSINAVAAEDMFFEALQRIEDKARPLLQECWSSSLSFNAAASAAASVPALGADGGRSFRTEESTTDRASATDRPSAGSPFADVVVQEDRSSLTKGASAEAAVPSVTSVPSTSPSMLRSVPSMRMPTVAVPADLVDVRTSLLSNLGKAYKEQGRLQESLEVLQEAWKAKKDSYGEK